MKIRLGKLIFGAREFFSRIMIQKMIVKMNLRIITRTYAADPEKGFLAKLIFNRYGRTLFCRQRGS